MPEPTKTIILDPPIEWNDKAYPEIVLREPTLDEMDRAQSELSQMKMVKRLIADVSGLPLQVIGKMPVSRVAEASDYFGGFTPTSPPTGET